MSMISVTPLSAPAASGLLFVLFLVKQEVLVSLGKKSKTVNWIRCSILLARKSKKGQMKKTKLNYRRNKKNGLSSSELQTREMQ